MPVAQLPTDLVEAPTLAGDLEMDYNRLKMWWTRKKIRSWKRGDGSILLSRSEVERYKAEQERITPRD